MPVRASASTGPTRSQFCLLCNHELVAKNAFSHFLQWIHSTGDSFQVGGLNGYNTSQ